MMYRIEAKLARWKQLYDELNEVRSRLRDGPAEPNFTTLQLMSEMRRLQRESEKALDEVHAAIAARGQPDCRRVA